MMETITLYRVWVSSKGPHLTSAQYKTEKRGYFVRLVLVSAKNRNWWPYYFEREYQHDMWRAKATPEEAWQSFIEETQGHLKSSQRALAHETTNIDRDTANLAIAERRVENDRHQKNG